MTKTRLLLALLVATTPAFAETYHFGVSDQRSNIAFESHTDFEVILGATNKLSGATTIDMDKGNGEGQPHGPRLVPEDGHRAPGQAPALGELAGREEVSRDHLQVPKGQEDRLLAVRGFRLAHPARSDAAGHPEGRHQEGTCWAGEEGPPRGGRLDPRLDLVLDQAVRLRGRDPQGRRGQGQRHLEGARSGVRQHGRKHEHERVREPHAGDPHQAQEEPGTALVESPPRCRVPCASR